MKARFFSRFLANARVFLNAKNEKFLKNPENPPRFAQKSPYRYGKCSQRNPRAKSTKKGAPRRRCAPKYYRHHSGYIGGLKEVQYKTLMATRPEMAMELAVKGMLPHNSLGAKAFTRLHVYAGENHEQAAQKPIVLD